MLRLDKTLQPNEQILFRTQKSLIIFLVPLLWTCFTGFVLFLRSPFLDPANGAPLINSLAALAWLPGIIAIFSWLYQALTYYTAAFIVTNQRLLMQEGFFFRHATATRLTTIAEIKIAQSLVGQLLNYGNITVNSFGGGWDVFSAIHAPYRFQQHIAESIHQLQQKT